MYVKVFGQVKTFQNKTTVASFAIRQVTDSNELVHHFLEVIASHLHATKVSIRFIVPLKGCSIPIFQGPFNKELRQGVADARPQMAGTFNNADTSADQGMVEGELSAVQQVVLKAFFDHGNSDHGKDVNTVIDTVRNENPHITEEDVKRSIIELQDEGHLYSTIDDQHFKTTVGV